MSRVSIDFSQNCGAVKIMHAVNNGPDGESVRGGANNRDYFREAEIPYVRNHDASFWANYGGEHTVDVHRIFKCFDADENDPNSYDFRATDGYLKSIESVGAKTFYRLGASIEHGTKQGTFPPKDNLKWAKICEHIILHYNEGWADGFHMGIEYWEIWNEPDCKNADGTNPCWQGSEDEFVEFYCTAQKYLKEKFPNLKIGGPAFCSFRGNETLVKILLAELSKRKIPFDFLSFHRYAYEPTEIGENIEIARNYITQYGYENAELILNEWNYIRGWLDDKWDYSVKAEKGLKGAAFIAGTMCEGQKHGLDMLMYYDARPCIMNGMFDTDWHTPLKGYYPFKMFSQLYKMGTCVASEADDGKIYTVAAKGDGCGAVMLTYFDDDDNAPAKEVEVCFENCDAGKKMLAEYYLLDENNDMKLVRSEKFTSTSFTAYLDMNLFTTYLIKITEI